MIRLFFLFGFLLFISCKTTTVAQAKKNDVVHQVKKPKIAKPKFTGDSNMPMAPNTMSLKGVFHSAIENVTFCDKTYPLMVEITIQEVLQMGSSSVRGIAKGQQIQFSLTNSLMEQIKASQLKLTAGDVLHITVKEGLCLDKEQTLYRIMTLK